jgi:hypothetical protein
MIAELVLTPGNLPNLKYMANIMSQFLPIQSYRCKCHVESLHHNHRKTSAEVRLDDSIPFDPLSA